jgi:hypothetical protein
LSGNLAYIKTNFGSISTTISHLEAVGAEMHGTLVLVKSTECEVGHACGKVGASLKFKLHNVLGRNYGYAAALCKISDIVSGNGVSLEEHEPMLNCFELTLFKYAPVTSCDEVTTGDNFYLTT